MQPLIFNECLNRRSFILVLSQTGENKFLRGPAYSFPSEAVKGNRVQESIDPNLGCSGGVEHVLTGKQKAGDGANCPDVNLFTILFVVYKLRAEV